MAISLFKKKSHVDNTPVQAVSALEAQVSQQRKRQEHLSTKMNDCVEEARAHLKAGRKTQATAALKRKKMYEQQANSLDATINNLENQILTLQGAQNNVEVVNSMITANQALKKIHKGINADKVDQIREDLEEQQDIANEIQDIISQPSLGMTDDADIEDELNMLDEEVTNEQFDVGSAPISAPVSQATPSVATKSEDDELNELMAGL